MTRTASLVAMALAVLGFIAIAAPKYVAPNAEAQEKKEGAWRGEIVDLAHYLGSGEKGEDHKQCAAAGQPVGLLTSDGKLFVLVGKGLDDAKKLVGSHVELKGRIVERSGLRGIDVASASEKRKFSEGSKPSEGSR